MAVSGSTRPLDNLPGPQQDGWPSLCWPSAKKDKYVAFFEPKVVDLIGGLTNWQLRIKEGN